MASRKSRVSQENRNSFPSWSRIQSDDQSVGASFINSISLPLEKLVTEYFRAKQNTYLTTAFTGEVDQTYRFNLPSTFEFNVDSTNSISPVVQSVTVSGLDDNTWYLLDEIEDGSIQSFWYEALPTRLNLVDQFSIDSYIVASGQSTDLELTLINSGLSLDNRLTVITDGIQLIEVDEDRNVHKSKVRLSGITWKQTNESEDINFLFAESKPTFKAWSTIEKVQPIDFVEDSSVVVLSNQFNQPFYLDSFDTISQFQDGRENLPLFWSLTTVSGNSILQANKYTSTRALDLLRLKPEIAEYRRWELLTVSGENVQLKDICLLPYQQRVLGIDPTTLYVWDTYQELPDIKQITLTTQNGLVALETSSDYILRGEEVEILCLFQKPIKTIVRHRLKIKYPDGSEYGILLDGTLIPTSSSYWVEETITERFLRAPLFLELEDLGNHLLTLEVVYLDQTTEFNQRLVLVGAKTALTQLDLSEITTTASGIDIDHQNRWLILNNDMTLNHIQPIYDIYLLDTDRKQIIFREPYDQVKVVK